MAKSMLSLCLDIDQMAWQIKDVFGEHSRAYKRVVLLYEAAEQERKEADEDFVRQKPETSADIDENWYQSVKEAMDKSVAYAAAVEEQENQLEAKLSEDPWYQSFQDAADFRAENPVGRY